MRNYLFLRPTASCKNTSLYAFFCFNISSSYVHVKTCKCIERLFHSRTESRETFTGDSEGPSATKEPLGGVQEAVCLPLEELAYREQGDQEPPAKHPRQAVHPAPPRATASGNGR